MVCILQDMLTDLVAEKRIILRKKGRNLAELKRKLNTAIYDDERGYSVIDSSLTLSQWFKDWMEIHKYNIIRNNTKQYYIQIFKKHIEPTLGKEKAQRYYAT